MIPLLDHVYTLLYTITGSLVLPNFTIGNPHVSVQFWYKIGIFVKFIPLQVKRAGRAGQIQIVNCFSKKVNKSDLFWSKYMALISLDYFINK